MHRDMQEVLERWGRWAASEEHGSLLDWPTMSVIHLKTPASGKPGCSDRDGIVIDSCIAHLSSVCRRGDLLILGRRYLCGHTTRFIAEATQTPRIQVRTSLKASEAFLEGCLEVLGIRLDMDPVVFLTEPLADAQKPVLSF